MSIHQFPPNGQQEFSAIDRMIPSKNAQALIGYYAGLFSLAPLFGLILGPAALILASRGFKNIRQHPGLPGRGHAIVAVIFGILGILVNLLLVTFFVMAMMSKPEESGP